jgi:hypothetical protein
MKLLALIISFCIIGCASNQASKDSAQKVKETAEFMDTVDKEIDK